MFVDGGNRFGETRIIECYQNPTFDKLSADGGSQQQHEKIFGEHVHRRLAAGLIAEGFREQQLYGWRKLADRGQRNNQKFRQREDQRIPNSGSEFDLRTHNLCTISRVRPKAMPVRTGIKKDAGLNDVYQASIGLVDLQFASTQNMQMSGMFRFMVPGSATKTARIENAD